MEMFEGLEQHIWRPLTYFGITHDFFELNAITIINTWLVILFLFITILGMRFIIHRSEIAAHLVFSLIEFFKDLTIQTFGVFIYPYFALVFSLFIFILLCNLVAIFPWASEPTRDINTTLACGLISFFYKDWQAIKTHGFRGFMNEFLEPFFIMFPINVIGHLSKIISLSLRLFGNIFGGSVILELYRSLISSYIITQILGLFGMNLVVLLFFGVFEGFMQAFVFAMLTMTYLGLAVQETPAGES